MAGFGDIHQILTYLIFVTFFWIINISERMEHLQHLLSVRSKNSLDSPDSLLKSLSSSPSHKLTKLTAQSRRFQEAKLTLSSQLTQTHHLFQRWAKPITSDFDSYTKLWNIVQKQFTSLHTPLPKHRPSLISYTTDVKQLINSNQVIRLKHITFRSEILQLIAGLLIENRMDDNSKRIILYTSKEVQKQYEYFYLGCQDKSKVDLDHDYREEILREIPNFEIRYFEDREVPKSTDSEDLVVFDLFGSIQSLYLPTLEMVHKGKLYKNLLVYTWDDLDIVYDEVVEIGLKFPVEVVQESNTKQTICKIIEETKLYAVKGDIIIFSTTPESQKKSIQDFFKNTKFKVNIITALEAYDQNTNNIFISSSSKELASWRYGFQHVIAVFDYGVDSRIHFSVEEKIYVETEGEIDQKEMELRMAFLGSIKPGKYFKLFDWRPVELKPFEREDLSLYILSMLSLGNDIPSILNGKSQGVKIALQKAIDVLKNLNIIEVNGTQGNVLDSKIHTFDISPFFAKMLLQLKGKRSQANILTYLIAALITPGSLKKSQNKNVHNIWKKEGDLSIYAEILYVYELEMEKTKRGEGKKVGEQNDGMEALEEEYAMFGNLYSEYKPKVKLLLSEMPLELILIELDLNEIFIIKCLENVRRIREAFKLKFIEYEDIDDEVPEVMELLLKSLDNGAVYTGSRRFGYKMKSGGNYLLAKDNILNILNERPNLILPLKVIKYQHKEPELLLASKIPEQLYLMMIGDLPVCSQKSSFSDTEIEFTGVSNAMFQALWKGSFIQTFQKKHACLVQPNQQIASIIIFCSKHSKALITQEFKTFMDSVKTKLESQVKQNDYYIWQLIFQKGGSIKEILDKNDTREIKLVNIPAETTTEEIKQLIEDYANIDNLVVQEDTKSKTKTAMIKFSTTTDLKWAIDQLDSTLFEGKKLKFLQKPKEAEAKKVVAESFVKFKWYAWPLTKKGIGIVIFKSEEGAVKASEVFARTFDSKEVVAEVKGRNLHLKGLNEITDETYLRSRLEIHGEIEDVQLEKTQTQESNRAETLIEHHVKLKIEKEEKFEILYVNKMSQGLRVAKVRIENPQSIDKISNAFNEQIGMIGKTRLYIEPQHVHPILIADHKMQRIYQDVLHESIKELNIDPNTINIKIHKASQNLYIILKSKNSNAITLIVNRLNSKLKEQPIDLSLNNKEIYFSEIGKDLLTMTQQQYKCKFVYHYAERKLGVICKLSQYESIIGELYHIPSRVIEDTVVCSMKTYKHLCKNPDKLEEIRASNFLEEVKIDHIGKSIRIKGLPYHLKQTRQTLLFYLMNIHTEGGGEAAEMCGICCEVLNRPYRLQICEHSFCEECLMFSINNAFGDASCFPLKCPHCLGEIAIQDLNHLLDTTSWAKLTNIAVNDFVNKNGDKYAFCYTANCRGLYNSRQSQFECKVCMKSYCVLCKADNHPGLTCSQAKDSNQVLLRKYMQQNDVRICPNPGCKMLMQRIDGCYRVTCSTCNQSICFKCPKEDMKIFPTADQCYKHLNDAHGGYW